MHMHDPQRIVMRAPHVDRQQLPSSPQVSGQSQQVQHSDADESSSSLESIAVL